MRLFVAINFPEEVKEEIVKSIEKLNDSFPQVAWTKKENIHLTIKFLGYVKTNLLRQIKQKIEDSICGVKPFELSFDKVGYFAREQLIIWLGVSTPVQLKFLIKRLDKEMDEIGFSKEKREFMPHITVGRGKHLDEQIMEKIKYEISAIKFTPLKPFSVSAITLMQSVLTPRGPIYTPVNKFAIG